MSVSKQPPAKRRGVCFDLAPSPSGLFVPSDEIQTKVWDALCPVWGQVVKYGQASQFDEVTYGQMLDDLVRRNLRVYMDQDHATANLGWSVDKVPALAYYCCVQVNHGGALWRRENLAGHTCADAAAIDPGACPEGLYAFRCQVTPKGREELPNYQALSIHFDPFGEDMLGHPVGQVLICVSAVNGPQVPGAIPAGDRFSRSKDMKKRKLFALEKGEGGAEDGAAETKDMSVEMAELAKALNLPEGSSPEAVIGAALAVVKTLGVHAEPDGDEVPMEKEADDLPADSMKYMEGEDEKMKGYARRAALRFSRPGRLVGLLSKELGCKAAPAEVLKSFVGFKARSVDGTEFAKLKKQVDDMSSEKVAEKAAAREAAIDGLFKAAGPTDQGGDGRCSSAKIAELRAMAQKYNASPEDVKGWLPDPIGTTFTAGGDPGGKRQPEAGDDRVKNAKSADDIRDLIGQYQKDTGKKLRYVVASEIYQALAAGKGYTYAAAKAIADRKPEGAFLKEGK